jgi:hypothetical protein
VACKLGVNIIFSLVACAFGLLSVRRPSHHVEMAFGYQKLVGRWPLLSPHFFVPERPPHSENYTPTHNTRRSTPTHPFFSYHAFNQGFTLTTWTYMQRPCDDSNSSVVANA